MCGISGEFRFDGRTADVAATARMTEPDGRPRPGRQRAVGVAGRSRSATAGCRSSTCPCAGSQPMVDSDLGLTVVFNGCIYNYQQLREELAGRGLPVLLARPTPR